MMFGWLLAAAAFAGSHSSSRKVALDSSTKRNLFPDNLTKAQQLKFEYLRRGLSLDYETASRVVANDPMVLSRINSSEENFKSKLAYFQKRLSLSDAELRKLVLTWPRVLSYRIEETVEPKFEYLQKRLSLNDAQLSKVIKLSHSVLSMNIEANLEPTLTYLQRKLTLSDEHVSKLVLRFPGVLGYCVEQNFAPKLEYLQERLSLKDEEVSKLVQRLPQVLGLSVEDCLEPKFEYFQKRLSLNDSELSKLVQRLPSLLGLSIEPNLEPTIEFIEGAVGEEVASAAILENPRLLSASLENRLKPRLAELRKEGFPVNRGALRRMAQYTKEQWSTSVAFQKKLLLQRGEDGRSAA